MVARRLGGHDGVVLKPSIGDLLADYRTGARTPTEVATSILERSINGPDSLWISRVDDDALLATARALEDSAPYLPLYGIPFAVKDNIDVAGLPTTAGCPGFSRLATRTAPVVQRLLDAGAILVGKTNMDQFATGLVGTRTPYGALSCAADPTRISGGSSSGSALAVALGHVAFALGTDTAGSGRVPAAFNGLVGVKPTRGLLSTRGVVPACASLDCVSILTLDLADAATVLEVAAGYDPEDPWSRREQVFDAPRFERVGLPLTGQAAPDDAAAGMAWAAARARAAECFAEVVEVDVTPLLEAAPLLYGAWMAERTAVLAPVIEARPEGLDPTVAEIILGGAARTGSEVFAATHELAALRRAAEGIFAGVDAILMPTVPGHPSLTDVAADPLGVNETLGRFTNFVNLLDLAALAVPGPPREDGLPAGVTLIAPAWADRRLLELGGRWAEEEVVAPQPGTLRLAVAGSSGAPGPLDAQLTLRGARPAGGTRTAAVYRVPAAPDLDGMRGGLLRVDEGRSAVAVDVWELSPAALGELVSALPAPLALGPITLEDGGQVTGLLCDERATPSASYVRELTAGAGTGARPPGG